MPAEYDEDFKVRVLKAVSQYGVRGAARKFRVPVSTLSMWRLQHRGQRDDLAPVPPTYDDHPHFTEHQKRSAVAEWEESTAHNRTLLVCSKYRVTRISFRRWVKKYGTQAEADFFEQRTLRAPEIVTNPPMASCPRSWFTPFPSSPPS